MNENHLRPIAFMVMPFRKRAVPNAPECAPKEVDFDALWDQAFRPALEDLGYLAVRADSETGSVIIKDMLERLAFADLVLADMTLPNGNVYYEVGIRHVAQRTNCVLVSAEWSKQLFDVDQMRAQRYPLYDGTVPAAEAAAIRAQLIKHLPEIKNSVTPYHELISDKVAATVFREQLETISSFQAEVRTARLTTAQVVKKTLVAELVAKYRGATLEIPEVSFELLTLVRDSLSWDALQEFVASLPAVLQRHAFVREQLLLAQSKLGDHHAAIAGLEELIKLNGDTWERSGLIGGRYKKLWRDARNLRTKRDESEPDLTELGYLDSAIESYWRGMHLDLNEYYCVCNLPGLLRARRQPGDEDEAAFLDKLTVQAAQRKIDRGEDDGWARSTLLGAAFRVGNVAEVARLAVEVVREGPAVWQLESTLSDINDAVAAQPASKTRQQLEKQRDQLAALL